MVSRIHLLKLCVGADGIADLLDWQTRCATEARARRADPRPLHVTRMWPKRADEVLAGGSLYWVFRGLVLARQPILALEPMTGTDGIRRCGLRLDPEVIRTGPQPRRPFQGWRYLLPEDAPNDLPGSVAADLPPALAADLAVLGVL